VLNTKYYWDCEIKKYEMGEACGMWWWKLKETAHLEDLGVDREIMLSCF
jgi:hypothetical protein